MPGAPWAILPRGRFNALKPLLHASAWLHGRKGITTDLNGVYFVDVVEIDRSKRLIRVRTRPGEGRTKLGPTRTFWVEPDMLYPLAKGAADFEACFFSPKDDLLAFVPNQGITAAPLEAADDAMAKLPRTRAYFRAFSSFLKARSTYRQRMKSAPMWAIYNVGPYSFAPYKVVWAEMTTDFVAAVATAARVPLVGKRPYIPDHKIFYLDFDQAEPAYFICGLMNAPSFKEIIEAHNISTQMGNLFKHVDLPAFDPTNSDHTALVQLVENNHREQNASNRMTLMDSVRTVAEAILSAPIKCSIDGP